MQRLDDPSDGPLIGVLIKEEQYLGYQDTSYAVTEVLRADTVEELVAKACGLLPNYDGQGYSAADAEGQLFVVAADLSEELAAAFAARVLREREERAAAVVRKKLDEEAASRQSRADRLRKEIAKLEEPGRLGKLREELAALET